MAAEPRDAWRDFFLTWPAAIPKRGVLISTLNEATPFKSFFTKGDSLLLERTTPDPLGGRFVVLGYEAIHMIKLTDPLKEDVLKAAGFVGQLAKL
jgi:hypothetical protein